MIAVKEFSREEVKEIRGAAKMTQAAFAEFLGVSKKTVEAWESGRNKPSGACCRLLALLEVNPAFPESYLAMLQKG
jgi:putative transcriptional regulator